MVQTAGDRARCTAFESKDTRFDRCFFVGTSTAGIYYRPVCRAKLPEPENCSFYTAVAAAGQAGFRLCLLCHPEFAPGNARVDAVSSLAHRTARLLEENCGSEQSMAELTGQPGCTGHHLRRAFAAEYHVTPIRYLQTCRLLLVKNLPMGIELSVIGIVMASGLGSLRCSNDFFQRHCRFAPTALHRQAAGKKESHSDVTVALRYRPPYQWQQILDFLALRATPGVEIASNGEYLHTVHLKTDDQQVYDRVRIGHQPQKNVLTVSLNDSLLPVLPQVFSRIRRLFDLYYDPDTVYEGLTPMNQTHPSPCVRDTRVPDNFDLFEITIRTVLGQQIIVKGARTLAAKLVAAYGIFIQTGVEGLTHTFPLSEAMLAFDGTIGGHLGLLGVTGVRVNTILELTRAFVLGTIDLSLRPQPEVRLQELMELSGIGPWTAQYIVIHAMGWTDAFPYTDYGIQKTLAPRTSKEVLDLAET